MVQIEDAIVSLDVIEKEFSCDMSACKGACCVAGDSGAPLEPDEILAIENALPSISNFLSDPSIETLEELGIAVIDSDGDLVTPLLNQKECAFVIFKNGIAECAIEKSWEKGTCTLQKPISCHLYPIRLKKYDSFTAVNYHSWKICNQAIMKGKIQKKHIFEFAKSALIRKFGEEWYNQLCLAADYVLHKNEKSEQKI
jgi:hypothetical protein